MKTLMRAKASSIQMMKYCILPGVLFGVLQGVHEKITATPSPTGDRTPSSDRGILSFLGLDPDTLVFQGHTVRAAEPPAKPSGTHVCACECPSGQSAPSAAPATGVKQEIDFVTRLPNWLTWSEQPALPREQPEPAPTPEPTPDPVPSPVMQSPEPTAEPSAAPLPTTRPCTADPLFERQGKIASNRSRPRSQPDICMLGVSGYRDRLGNSRALYWNSNGLFSTVIFLNREGKASANSWGRSLQLFPRLGINPDITYATDDSAQIVMANGRTMNISSEVIPENYTGGELDQSGGNDLSPPQRGGIEFKSQSGILIDYGWARGRMPVELADGKAQVTDPHGKSCTVKNAELLKRIPLPNGKLSHVEFIFKTDAELAQFLSKKCPTLDLSVLAHD